MNIKETTQRNKKMPTTKQKRVAKLVIENSTMDKPMTGGEIVESSGYGVSMKKNPQVILESDGVKEALVEYGFSEDNAKQVVADIMLNDRVDPSARLKATDQVFKVHGSYAPEKTTSTNLNVEVKLENKELEDIRVKYEKELKDKLLHDNTLGN